MTPRTQFEEMLSDEILPHPTRLEELYDIHEEAVDKYNDIKGKKYLFSITMNRRGSLPQNHCEQVYGEEVCRNMEYLAISDPYELSFALLYLIEQDSDI